MKKEDFITYTIGAVFFFLMAVWLVESAWKNREIIYHDKPMISDDTIVKFNHETWPSGNVFLKAWVSNAGFLTLQYRYNTINKHMTIEIRHKEECVKRIDVYVGYRKPFLWYREEPDASKSPYRKVVATMPSPEMDCE